MKRATRDAWAEGRPSTNRRFGAALAVVAMLGGLLLPLALAASPAGAAPPVTGGAFTTVNEGVDGTGHCKNGNPGVNCNIYDGNQYVWMSGGPIASALGDGTYFFAVLDPGGQADPNDGSAKNLSDDFDAYTNRTFTLSGGTITAYGGSHTFDSNEIRLADYADTSNPGGVYIMAICSLGEGYPVNASDCKYDAFKVQETECTTDCPVPPAAEPTVSKDAAGAYTDTWTWTIQKDVDKTTVDIAPNGTATFNYTVTVSHDGGTVSGVTVTGTIDVTNPNFDSSFNTVPLDISSLSDQLSDGTNCDITGGPTAGHSVTLTQFDNFFPYTCTLSALPEGNLDNTATAGWDAQTLSNGTALTAGTANFIFQGVTFTGTNVDDSVSVTDTLGGTLGTVSASDPSPTTFTYSQDFSGDPAGTCTSHDNTATFTTNISGTTNSASQTVHVCVGADLQVSKTAVPAFTRTYLWSIGKSVDKTLVKQVGGSATFNYTVTATQTGFVDSGWNATGVITVSNPNDWEAITADVSDAVDNGGSCTVANGTAVSVPASGSVQVAYTCTYANAPAPASGTNTATATWDAAAASTANGSATGTAGVAFVTPTTRVNQTITVTDTFNGSTTTLGTVTATDSTPFASRTFTYARVIAIPASGCTTYPNTARIVETGQTAGTSVTVCGPIRTGALTIGYWQNKNGQAIITGGASVGTVCKSGTWLRQFAPFQDLSATATCAQVAAYDVTIFKAANAGGTTMNPMLKAQMLATAFNVYFSDPALGGNKIGAPTPLGGVTIDLTSICKMIDASGGTATCSGAFENVSAAFGGATSMTVLGMLTYAASQSNAGGSVWYGNVKATQGLAKDAFDAINNQVAFAP